MRAAASLLFIAFLSASAQTPDWSQVNAEAMRHFQALIQIDSTDPPGNETRVVDYVRKVFDAEDIPYIVAAKDPARANIIARLKGNGAKAPPAHRRPQRHGQSRCLKVDVPPIQRTRNGGYVYGRGTLDDKPNLMAAMMTMVLDDTR
jgi:acetylornithine deacetylase/succinyl-diaminopimelate desuccinylase-like protein